MRCDLIIPLRKLGYSIQEISSSWMNRNVWCFETVQYELLLVQFLNELLGPFHGRSTSSKLLEDTASLYFSSCDSTSTSHSFSKKILNVYVNFSKHRWLVHLLLPMDLRTKNTTLDFGPQVPNRVRVMTRRRRLVSLLVMLRNADIRERELDLNVYE